MRRAQGGFSVGIIVDGARHSCKGSRYVGQHGVDMRELVARKIVGRNICRQPGLH